ncbi:MAG: nucleotide sugar dehydrogenase [Acidobacteriota bacterium]|nr:nucleotide sugar dehydrogenase [Acidobacteriota bacterium]
MSLSNMCRRLKSGEAPIAVVGLGYVGLPLAVHMARKFRVVGFDVNKDRIARLKSGKDDTGEVSDEDLGSVEIGFSHDPDVIADSPFIIVAVPTPIDDACNPDLRPMIGASRSVGKALRPGSVVVFESTVYPGVTEDVCGPVLEEESGLVCGRDFFLAYSPERINPGDKVNTFDTIVKVVSGQTPEVLDLVTDIYSEVVTAGVHRAPSIRVAEAAKVIENTQRDLNIALMNELAILFDKIGIDTLSVLRAAGTKWNFLRFTPGLVGGHCIGVDPYYLTYLSQKVGYHPRVILSGRQINDGMGKFVAEQTIKQMIKAHEEIAGARVLVMGLSFKENVPDMRNSKVFDVIQELREYEVEVLLHDPMVVPEELREEYGEEITPLEEVGRVDAVVLAVNHRHYLEMGVERICAFAKPNTVLVDVKGALPHEDVEALGLRYWRL